MVDLIPDHEKVQVFHPKTSSEVPAYLQKAAEKELKRMLEGGLLEETNGYTEHVSRGCFVEKNTQPGEQVKTSGALIRNSNAPSTLWTIHGAS